MYLQCFFAVEVPMQCTCQALAARTYSPQQVEWAACSPASFSLHGSRLVLRMMKALVVVFPTSSLSNTMPSCRICRHRDFPSARHPQQHQHLVWRQQVVTRNHTIKWHAAVWTYPGLAVQPQLCRHCFETCHCGKRKRLTLLRGVRGLAGATSSFLPLAPGLLAAAAGGVCGLTVAGAAPGGGAADFEPGPLAGTGVGKRSLPAQEGNPWDCFAWATWQPSLS